MQTDRWVLALALLVGAAWAGNAAADETEEKLKDATERLDKAAQKVEEMLKNPPSSGDDFTGDRLTLRTTVMGLAQLNDPDNDDWIAPAGTKLRVISEKDGKLTLGIEKIPCILPEVQTQSDDGAAPKNRLFEFSVKCGDFDADKVVRPGEAYTVAKSEIEKHGFRRSGWVYGALLVPYKYHRDDKSFSSAVTIGPYLGWRLDGLGFDTSFIGSIGIASLSVPNGSGGTSTLQGYTAAIGIIGAVTKNKNPLQLGVLVGKDWAGSNSAVPYAHEGRTWLAAQIGFSFGE